LGWDGPEGWDTLGFTGGSSSQHVRWLEFLRLDLSRSKQKHAIM
jgi:hypothetical protein